MDLNFLPANLNFEVILVTDVISSSKSRQFYRFTEFKSRRIFGTYFEKIVF